MKYILFVCTGNTCRSSMAESLLRDKIEKAGKEIRGIKVDSAGVCAVPNQPANPQAITTMKQEGIDLTSHRSKPLTNDMLLKADLILTMTVNHKNTILKMEPSTEGKVFTLKEYALEDIDIDKTLDELGKLYYEFNKKRDKLEKERKNEIRKLKKKREELIKQIKNIDKEIYEWKNELEEELEKDRTRIMKLEESIPSLDVKDPFGMPIDEYVKSAKEIKEALIKILEKIKNDY